MATRKTVFTLCVVAALASISPPTYAQSDVPSSLSVQQTTVAVPQIEPLFLALFGAGAVGLGLFLRRYLAD